MLDWERAHPRAATATRPKPTGLTHMHKLGDKPAPDPPPASFVAEESGTRADVPSLAREVDSGGSSSCGTATGHADGG